jgi:hypothetical protein
VLPRGEFSPLLTFGSFFALSRKFCRFSSAASAPRLLKPYRLMVALRLSAKIKSEVSLRWSSCQKILVYFSLELWNPEDPWLRIARLGFGCDGPHLESVLSKAYNHSTIYR